MIIDMHCHLAGAFSDKFICAESPLRRARGAAPVAFKQLDEVRHWVAQEGPGSCHGCVSSGACGADSVAIAEDGRVRQSRADAAGLAERRDHFSGKQLEMRLRPACGQARKKGPGRKLGETHLVDIDEHHVAPARNAEFTIRQNLAPDSPLAASRWEVPG